MHQGLTVIDGRQDVPTFDVASSLSVECRARTAALHAKVEHLLGLPNAIRSRSDYVLWLHRFLGLYEPLELSLATFSEWKALGLTLESRSHANCLVADLTALGADPFEAARTPSSLLPDLPTFPHALGALYVLEGSTLGGRLILRNIETRIGPCIEGATGFLGGRREAVGPMWRSFQAALDGFGRERPQLREDVVTGAQRAFVAILTWFTPFRSSAADRP